jgi:hypothetical protein
MGARAGEQPFCDLFCGAGGGREREDFQVSLTVRATQEIQQACVHNKNKKRLKISAALHLPPRAPFIPGKIKIGRQLKAGRELTFDRLKRNFVRV